MQKGDGTTIRLLFLVLTSFLHCILQQIPLTLLLR
jgi:hypothetical protein